MFWEPPTATLALAGAGLLRSDERVEHDFLTSCTQRQATANLAAHSSAFSREGTSTIANPPMTALVSGYGPSVTVPSVATMLALWLSTPPPKIHTPASWAARTTAWAASPTAGSSSSGKVIAPSSNEIRYRVIP